MASAKAALAALRSQVQGQVDRFLNTAGSRSVDWFHRELGRIVWDNCGMARSEECLKQALNDIPALKE